MFGQKINLITFASKEKTPIMEKINIPAFNKALKSLDAELVRITEIKDKKGNPTGEYEVKIGLYESMGERGINWTPSYEGYPTEKELFDDVAKEMQDEYNRLNEKGIMIGAYEETMRDIAEIISGKVSKGEIKNPFAGKTTFKEMMGANPNIMLVRPSHGADPKDTDKANKIKLAQAKANAQKQKIEIMKLSASTEPILEEQKLPDAPQAVDYSRYHFYTDGGHGWLKVPLEELATLNIKDKITGYSYIDDKFAYLEEDLDMGVFLTALGIGWSATESEESKQGRKMFWDNVKTTDTSTSSRQIFIRNLYHYDTKKFARGGGLDDETVAKLKSLEQNHFNMVQEAIKAHPEAVKLEADTYADFHKKAGNDYYMGGQNENLDNNPNLHLHKDLDGYYEAYDENAKVGYYLPYDASSPEKLKRISIPTPNYFKMIGNDPHRLRFDQVTIHGRNVIDWVQHQDTPEAKTLNGVSDDIESQQYLLRSVKVSDILKTDKKLAEIISKGTKAKSAESLIKTPIVIGNDIENGKKRKGVVLYGYDQVAQYVNQGRESIPALVSVIDVRSEDMEDGGDMKVEGMNDARIQKLKDAGFTTIEIEMIWKGWGEVLPVEADGGSSGMRSWKDEGVDARINMITDNAKKGLFEAGMKYLSFIPNETGRESGSIAGFMKKIGFDASFQYEAVRKNLNNEIVHAKYTIYPYKSGKTFVSVSKGNYQGIISRDKKELFNICKKITGSKDIYFKDFQYGYNNLGGISISDGFAEDVFNIMGSPMPPDTDKSTELELGEKMETGGTALAEGIIVEHEHKDLYDLLEKRLKAKDVAMPISENEFYGTIAQAHLNEKKDYYVLLKKCVEKEPSADNEASFRTILENPKYIKMLTVIDNIGENPHNEKLNHIREVLIGELESEWNSKCGVTTGNGAKSLCECETPVIEGDRCRTCRKYAELKTGGFVQAPVKNYLLPEENPLIVQDNTQTSFESEADDNSDVAVAPAPVKKKVKSTIGQEDKTRHFVREIGITLKNLDGIPNERITNSRDIFDMAKKIWNKDLMNVQEQFYVLYLDRSSKIIGYDDISKGGVSGTVVDTKIIGATAVKALSSSLIIMHNHPSSVVRPSDEDIRATREVKEAMKLLQIKLLDHVIMSEHNYFSFADEGMM
jgi:DNA repair protein RadC